VRTVLETKSAWSTQDRHQQNRTGVWAYLRLGDGITRVLSGTSANLCVPAGDFTDAPPSVRFVCYLFKRSQKTQEETLGIPIPLFSSPSCISQQKRSPNRPGFTSPPSGCASVPCLLSRYPPISTARNTTTRQQHRGERAVRLTSRLLLAHLPLLGSTTRQQARRSASPTSRTSSPHGWYS